MAYEITGLMLDLKANTAHVTISKNDDGQVSSVTVHFPLKTPGNQTEKDLRQLAKIEAKSILQAAVSVL